MTNAPRLSAPVYETLRRAQVLHATRRLAEAEALYREILTQEPDHAPALGLLGMILVDRVGDLEAEDVIQRHLALRPNDGASLHALGQLRVRQGDDAAAVDLFRRAAQWLPKLAPIHCDLGGALHRLGRDDEALAAFGRAVELDPAYGAAHGNRGIALLDAGCVDEAFGALLAALAHAEQISPNVRASILDNLVKAGRKSDRLGAAEAVLRREFDAGWADADTVEPLSEVLDLLRRPREAQTLRNDLARRTGVRRGGSASAATTVLVLGGVGAGHVPIRYLLDTTAFATTSVSLLSPDQADAPLGSVSIDDLRSADVILSTLGDVDHNGGQLDAATDLLERLGKPVVNPPRSILRTGRDQAARLFGDIAGMITPLVERTTPDGLAARTIGTPLLVRPAGDHGGDNLVLLRDEVDKTRYLAGRPHQRLLVSQFRDFRSADGFWRKYRLIFVDRRVFPYHLAIGDDWLVHYWRADTGRSDWKKAEEERFLTDWRGVFGEPAALAVEETARRLDLDYGGMDCTLMPDGRVLLFEANACMLAHLDEPAHAFPYKHRFVPPIREAFTRMVRERAGQG